MTLTQLQINRAIAAERVRREIAVGRDFTTEFNDTAIHALRCYLPMLSALEAIDVEFPGALTDRKVYDSLYATVDRIRAVAKAALTITKEPQP